VPEGVDHGGNGRGAGAPVVPAERFRLPRALRPLRHREFALLAGSAAGSLLADGIWVVASVWQVMAMGGGPSDVSLALMPVSMALAGPVGERVGIPVAFVAAAVVPPVLAVIALGAWRLPRDEVAHPLNR